MQINEHIVINKPKSVMNGPSHGETAWVRRAFLRSIWEMRKRVMEEQGVDIFQLYEMSDCIEVHIEGDFVGKPVPKDWELKLKRREQRSSRRLL